MSVEVGFTPSVGNIFSTFVHTRAGNRERHGPAQCPPPFSERQPLRLHCWGPVVHGVEDDGEEKAGDDGDEEEEREGDGAADGSWSYLTW